MVKYCIFDLDGTLLDTLPTIKHHLNTTLVNWGLSPVGDAETKRYIGDGAYKLIYRAFSEQGITDEEKIAAAVREYKAAYDNEPYYLTKIYDGIVDALDTLQGAGVTLAVLSNKPNEATEAVISHFLPNRFEIARGGIDGIPLKPDSAAPLSLVKQLGGLASECAFVGDTSVDILTGRNMGACVTVGVSWGFRERAELLDAGADVVIDHPSGLADALGVAQ